MSKFDLFLDCLVRDFFAVVLSMACISLSMGLCYLLFDERTSFFVYFISFIISMLIGGYGSLLVVKLLLKKLPIGHTAAVSLIISLATLFCFLVLPAIEMGGLWEYLTFVFGSPYDCISGSCLGLVIVSIMYLCPSLLGVAALLMK